MRRSFLASDMGKRFSTTIYPLLYYYYPVPPTIAAFVGVPPTENVGDCGTEGRKGGGKERKKRRKRAEKSGTCYFDASSFFLRKTQNIGISEYI